MSNILRAGLIGRDIGRSLSPEIHRELFKYLSVVQTRSFDDIEYKPITCENEGAVLDAIDACRSQCYRGLNFTAPFKTFLAKNTETSTLDVRQVLSANTISFDSIPRAYSTDGLGFLSAIRRRIEIRAQSYHLLILGNGGAARSICQAVKRLPWLSMTLHTRSMDFAGIIRSQVPTIDIRDFDKPLPRKAGKYFVVQATNIGQNSQQDPAPWLDIREEDVVTDIVYTPMETELLRRASRNGATAIDGLGMLIEQAAIAQFIWVTGTFEKFSPLTQDQFEEMYSRFRSTFQKQWADFAI